MSAKPVLSISKNGAVVKTQPLDGEACFGRADSCAVKLDDRAISRNHAVFRETPEGIQVEKKSEFAPLSVNGVECTSALLKEGDEVALGPYRVKLTLVQSVDETPKLQDGDATRELKPLDELNLVQLNPPTTDSSENQGDEQADVAPIEEALLDPFPQSEGESPLEVESVDSGRTLGVVLAGENDATHAIDLASLDVALILAEGVANVTELSLERDETSIGRDRGCDVVLNEKKASRKHAVIRREGAQFVLRDLDSANGTFVNGVRVTERTLEGGDRIRVGSSEILFRAASIDYADREHGFLPVPEEVPAIEEAGFPAELLGGTLDAGATPDSEVQSPQSGFDGIPGLGGTIPGLNPGRKTSLLERYRALPPVRKAMWTCIVIGLLYFGIFDEDTPTPNPGQRTHAQAHPSPGPSAGVVGADFNSLSSGQKKFVDAQHELGFAHLKNKEYDKSVFEIRKVFQLVSDYKDSREIERYAIEGKRKREAIDEEMRKRAAEEKIRSEVAELVAEIGTKMKKHDYEVAQAMFSDVLTRDPENSKIHEWKQEIRDWEDKKLEEAKMAEVRKQVSRHAWERYRQGVALKDKGKFYPAIAIFSEVAGIDASDRRPANKSKEMIEACHESIDSLRSPVLVEAKSHEDQGELKEAYDLFERATQIDSRHPEGFAGMDRIRRVLHDRAKVTYTEAVIAESYSDFTTARKKFEETMSIAPAEDVYFQRSKRKLGRFLSGKAE